MLDQKNLIIAIVLSVAILIGFQYFYAIPQQEAAQRQLAQQQAQEQAKQQRKSAESGVPSPSGAPGLAKKSAGVPVVPGAPAADKEVQSAADRAKALKASPRLAIRSTRLRGSIALKGARIDDIELVGYRQTLDKKSPNIVLMSPTGSEHPYYVQFGWSTAMEGLALPNGDSVWQTNNRELTPGKPVTLKWDNGKGLVFTRIITLDENYLFTVTQRVENNSSQEVTLYPYGLIARIGMPETAGFYILHEGPLGVFGGTLTEIDYEDLIEKSEEKKSTGGWLGITDKYWLTALAPDAKAPFTGNFRYIGENDDRYQVDYLREGMVIPRGAISEVTDRLFIGAKEFALLETYRDVNKIEKFDLAIDFGWLHLLTKPLLKVLIYFYQWIGNMGLSILLLTVCVKTVFFPLANKSYKSMSKMKALQPEMEKLREKHGDDKQKLNKEMMALYKSHKANPAAGCLPIVIQIPVFFALYKVLYVAIEMRHAPFFGWVQDLSAPDPTTLFNLFGLIPFDPPQFLMIGVWPLAMGISMFLQMRLNPQPTDPMQAKIFMFMPLFFTFLLAPFAAGLVVYWTWNNCLSMAQQWVIMKRMGVPIGRKAAAQSKSQKAPGRGTGD